MQPIIKETFQRLRQQFDIQAISTITAEWLINIATGLLVMILFYISWKIIRKVTLSGLKRSHIDETATALVETLLKYGFFTLGLATALNSMGVKMTAVLASFGVAGLTIGFAARDALSNIISGILIFMDRPFVIGDLVEIEGIYGKVHRITLRSTRIVTVDGKMMAVPNTEIINKTVASYTNFPHLRLDIPITVAVHENLGRVREFLLSLVEGDPEFLSDPAPRVVVAKLNDYNVEMQLQVWLKNERKHKEIRYLLREQMFNKLSDEHVDMPFETISVNSTQR